jgi:hypothetical protein
MQKVIYANQGGLGIILDQNESEADVFKQEPIEVGTSVLSTGTMTTLYGFFKSEVRYVGTYHWEGCNRLMVFCAGSEKDLFDTQTYYYLLAYISPTMIANKYSDNSARGYQLKNGQWK